MSQPKNLPFPVGFTNTRTFKKIRVDFPAAAGLGAAILLIDYAVAQPNHEFYLEDLDFLSRDFDVSRKILEDIVLSYDLFKIYEKDDKKVVSPFIIKQLEPYYKAVEAGKLGGEITSTKRKIKQKQQLLELHNKLSEVNSIQGCLEYPTSTLVPNNKLINKIKEENKETLSRESRNERDIFKNLQSFKSHFINKNTNVPFYTQGIGYEPATPFKINESKLVVNMVNSKILSKEEALEVWEYLFNFYQNQKIGA
ncbi:MAG: hypothetical protein WCY51_07355 [Sulfurimonas sp.]|uniref:hypothetical protein n=1 Tax=Sulfurimonas sp. TaxID=2022749 RepID=UPI0025EECE67|nr:hypothetical protein [Sulfurimonas sp.]MCK9455207.1 hypothetical protein [Sulfurimonas sp.]